jgi:hypothetical protein
VAFPDEDSWYPPGFLVKVATLLKRDAKLNFCFYRDASRPAQASFAVKGAPFFKAPVPAACAPTIVLSRLVGLILMRMSADAAVS